MHAVCGGVQICRSRPITGSSRSDCPQGADIDRASPDARRAAARRDGRLRDDRQRGPFLDSVSIEGVFVRDDQRFR